MNAMLVNPCRFRTAILAVSTLLAATGASWARGPLDLIPAESLLCWNGRALPDLKPIRETPSSLRTLLELGARLAGEQLDSGTQLTVRAAELFSLMIRHPHALALIDVRAAPAVTDPTARRVDHLRCVLTVKSGDQREPFLRVIQKAVNDQVNAETASLDTRRARSWTYQELRDHRLPPWCIIAWGWIDDHFVITVGRDVWPQVAAIAAGQSPSLSQDPWLQSIRPPHVGTPIIEIIASVAAVRKRLDPFIQGRASRFFQAWEAGALHRGYWALGLQGRALFCVAQYGFGPKTVRRLYADPNVQDERLLSTVPPQSRYAIYDLPLDRFLRRFFRGLTSIVEGRARENLARIWSRIEATDGFNVERDLLANIGPHVVLHNHPPHPLRIPVAVTGLVEIRSSPNAVRRSLDAICTTFRDAVIQAESEGRAAPPWRLEQATDGVWYLRFGPLAGPAWTVADDFLIFSWSPQALRQYLTWATANAPGPTSQPIE